MISGTELNEATNNSNNNIDNIVTTGFDWNRASSATATHSSSNPNSANKPKQDPDVIKYKIKLRLKVANYILERSNLTWKYPHQNYHNLANQFARYIFDTYQVKCYVQHNTATTAASSSTNSTNDVAVDVNQLFELEIHSKEDTYQDIKRLVKDSSDVMKVKEEEAMTTLHHTLQQRQAVVMTRDWRCLMHLQGPFTTTDHSVKGYGQRILPLWHYQRLANQLPTFEMESNSSSNSQARFVEFPYLPYMIIGHPSKNNLHSNSVNGATDANSNSLASIVSTDVRHILQNHKYHYYAISEQVAEMNFFTHLRSLLQHKFIVQLLPGYVQEYVWMLMVRFLHHSNYEDQDLIRESTSLLSAVIMLACKYHNLWKVKYMSRLIRVIYCQVFRRDEKDLIQQQQLLNSGSNGSVHHIEDSYLPRVLNMEIVISECLGYDLYQLSIYPNYMMVFEEAARKVHFYELTDLCTMAQDFISRCNQYMTRFWSFHHVLLIPFPIEVIQMVMLQIVMAMEVVKLFANDQLQQPSSHASPPNQQYPTMEYHIHTPLHFCSQALQRRLSKHSTLHKLIAEHLNYFKPIFVLKNACLGCTSNHQSNGSSSNSSTEDIFALLTLFLLKIINCDVETFQEIDMFAQVKHAYTKDRIYRDEEAELRDVLSNINSITAIAEYICQIVYMHFDKYLSNVAATTTSIPANGKSATSTTSIAKSGSAAAFDAVFTGSGNTVPATSNSNKPTKFRSRLHPASSDTKNVISLNTSSVFSVDEVRVYQH